MSSPLISVLLPAYNCERFLTEAVDSVLYQTLSDFELLIINDGSNDNTEKIIRSYTDNRIVYIKNDKNLGLIYTLNKGIDLAKGKYIARMDADDMCVKNRLQKQFDWLESHAETAVAGCHISFIDEEENTTGEWETDLQTSTSFSIRQRMVWENCLAHPSVMVRAEVLKKYQYIPNQKHTEDYDLWLRMLADGLVIEKVPEKLLLYRIHESSVTGSILRKSNPFFKQYNCKSRFLMKRIKEGKWGMFETKVLVAMMYDGVMGLGKNLKKAAT